MLQWMLVYSFLKEKVEMGLNSSFLEAQYQCKNFLCFSKIYFVIKLSRDQIA